MSPNPELTSHVPSRTSPSVTGAYLSAVVTYATLLEKTPRGLPSTLRLFSGTTISIDPKIAALLQDAAAEVTGR